jgi:hypothetical protein
MKIERIVLLAMSSIIIHMFSGCTENREHEDYIMMPDKMMYNLTDLQSHYLYKFYSDSIVYKKKLDSVRNVNKHAGGVEPLIRVYRR